MYTNHFGFREKPFNLTASTKYLYLGEQHQTALTLLHYGIRERAGISLLTGGTGTGKTSLVRQLMESFRHNGRLVMLHIENPTIVGDDLCGHLLAEMGKEEEAGSMAVSFKAFAALLEKEHRKGHQVVLVVDEAQCLTDPLLEQVRMLTNLEKQDKALIQVILVGQDELRARLATPALRTLAQRITVVEQLQGLPLKETLAYMEHRMKVAGRDKPGLFSKDAVRELHDASEGIPRVLNMLSDMALTYGYSEDAKSIDAKIVADVLNERMNSGLPLTPKGYDAAAAGGGILSERMEKLEGSVRKIERVLVRHLKRASA